MDLLLDSHAAVWWADDPSLLADSATSAIADPARIVWFTSASAWELSIKIRSGKLRVDVDRLIRGLVGSGVRLLGIGVDDAITAGSLDWEHRDPFDRMIVAQAIRNNLTVVTRDDAIRHFERVSHIVA